MDRQLSSVMASNLLSPQRVTLSLEFPHGIPAFETQKRFRLIDRDPLMFLESETTPGLSFLLLPVTLIHPGYRLALAAADRQSIRASSKSRLAVYAVVTAVEDLPSTANLLAPVVINLDSKLGIQAVRSDSVYSHKYLLLPEEAPCS